TLDRASDGSVSGFEVSQNGQTHSFSRIGPLAGDLKPTPDPDTDLTAGVQAAVLAMASSGGRDVAMLSPGAQKDLADPLLELTGLNGISYVGAVDELSRHLVRHDTDVARTLYYKANGAIHGKYVLVFMTGDNHIADLDLVEE
ncbi:MAG TPA: hypothetical protein VGS41_00375, partial [Chthonomonadales bacterium]|nr:hypothetical protein [Chthonomonadales bacterium]